jgi:general secretion pathway protein D
MKNTIKLEHTMTKSLALGFAAGCILWAAMLQAQQFGGFGGAANTQRSSTRTDEYPSSTDIGQARITYDQETRSIIVVADDETAMHITNMVRQLDRPTPQVLINCVFMEATHAKGLDIGVDGYYQHTISSDKFEAFNGTGTAATAFDLATSGGLYTLVGQDLTINFAALAKAGKTEILSRPSILARNNQQATITIGQQVPLISGVTYDTFGNQRNAITYEDVGIILRVTPFITSDGMVEMIVAPEVSSVSDSTVSFATSTNDQGSATAPIINVRSADTVVVVPDGETVVIGGLMQTLKVKTEQKVPLLGDIPLVGLLFKHKVTSDEKKELLIFLTPHIVKRPSDLIAHTANERKKAEAVKKAFTEEELDQYLNSLPMADDPTHQRPPLE